MNNQPLTLLEKAVLEKMLIGNNRVFEVIKEQLASATVSKRELTGSGFFTRFALRASTKKLPKKSKFMIADVSAKIPRLKNGADFILWIENGVILSLEGFTYDEAWPKEITSFELAFLSERPPGSGKLWHSDTRDMDFALTRLDLGT